MNAAKRSLSAILSPTSFNSNPNNKIIKMPKTTDEKLEALIESQNNLVETQKNLIESQTSLVNKITELTSTVEKLATQYTDLKQRVSQIEQQLTRPLPPPPPQQPHIYKNPDVDSNVHQRFAEEQEYQQRIDKQYNIVIENLADDGAAAVSDNDRSNPTVNRELVEMRKLVESVGGRADSVLGVFRMGWYVQGKNRPLKLKLEDSRTRRALLKNQSKISGLSLASEKYKAWGRPDLTDMQRNKWNSAKEKIRSVNTRYGKNDGYYLIKIDNDDCELNVSYREFNQQSKRVFYSHVCTYNTFDQHLHSLQYQQQSMETGNGGT
jgi:uncharacterized membrane-anchored protein YhcB (DUF1043 family)